jgi:serine/threonine-protein kinase
MGAGAGHDGRFPVADWGSYELREYLGSGAMGSVYKAWDRQLQRPVALKFLLGDNPSLIGRFQQEARAQARVEHDNLCKIYEVGQTEGRHYIAMQLIEGERLTEAARKMTLTEKVLAVRDVARALHEAHRAGLIHRDVKPSNIMVARERDGRWKPFVLDFGLAREARSAGLTMTGAVLGTPAYMAPEQARGEIHKLDRRSDVYGLGATLYDMLTDRPPFPGDSFHQILPQVLDDVPSPPRDTHPEVPADVESIALKCLRKDPGERYDSARALADDLQRWLDGDAVVARPTSRWYRMRMKARKNRVAVRVAAVALPVVMAAVGWGIWNQYTSARQQELAQEFGQRVQRMESIARIAAMAPLHDIRPEREMIRRQMVEIQESIRHAGNLARGPGEYALGRGHLALGDVDEAREHLESAWDAGYRPPEVSYALGLVLGRQYQDRLQEIATVKDEEERDERRAAARTELRDPAMTQLREAAAVETESPQYVEALMALYDDRHDEALAKARAAYAEHPWLYEANRLEGEILQLTADELRNGGDYDAASRRYAEAVTAIERAANVARSDPSTYTQLAMVALSRITLEVNHRGLDVTPHYEDGIRATDLAAAANPDDAEALAVLAGIHKRVAEYRISQGQEAGEHLDNAIAAAERAVELDPGNAPAYRVLGSTYRQIGKDVRRRGDDPRPAFGKAIEAYEIAGRLAPDWAFFASLGLLHKDIAVYQSGVGEDPRESFEEAIAAYERSIELRPMEWSTHYNLGNVRKFLARHEIEEGTDPQATLRRAISAFREASTWSPGNVLTLQSLGGVLNELALYELETGSDPTATLDSATVTLTEALSRNQDSNYAAHLHEGLGFSHSTRVEFLLSRGEDPSADVQAAIDRFLAAIDANPTYFFSYCNLSDLYATLASHAAMMGEDPRHLVEMAVAYGRQSVDMDPTWLFAYGAMASALQAEALYRIANDQDPDSTIALGSSYTDSILAANDRLPDAYCAQGTFQALRARWLCRTSGATDNFSEAEDWIVRALVMSPANAAYHLARAELLAIRAECEIAQGHAPVEVIARGLEAAAASMERNRNAVSANALYGALLLMKADCSEAPENRALRQEARRWLGDALTKNPFLEHRFRSWLVRAEEPGTGVDGA